MNLSTKVFESKLTPEELQRHKAFSTYQKPAHIFKDDSYGFSYNGPIQELKLLSESSSLYVSLKQKRLELLQYLKKIGVKFVHIENHLTNQAKKAGLWPPGAKAIHVSRYEWFVQMGRFVSWANRNFKDYGVPVEAPKPKAKKPKEIVVRRESKKQQEPTAPATLPPKVAPSNIPAIESQSTLHVASSTPHDREDAIVLGNQPTLAAPTSGIFDKLVESLTPLQISTIVFQNLGILGAKALELGAGEEFNLLMEAMGLIHEMVPVEVIKSLEPSSLGAN